MAVFRIDKTRDYTVMANHHLRNKALSLKAKGLLSLMLSLPEDWDYTTKGLSMICKDGVDSITFALWKNSKFFSAKKKALTKSLAAELLKSGRAPLKGCWSEKTGKTYDAVVVLDDDGQRVGYKLVFGNG